MVLLLVDALFVADMPKRTVYSQCIRSHDQDYESDRLMLSNLQLSDGTVVILDETKLEPGPVRLNFILILL